MPMGLSKGYSRTGNLTKSIKSIEGHYPFDEKIN
jgi:hypothetical protein